jgi:hypothetical protein
MVRHEAVRNYVHALMRRKKQELRTGGIPDREFGEVISAHACTSLGKRGGRRRSCSREGGADVDEACADSEQALIRSAKAFALRMTSLG